jgi:hypothetical protein
MTIILIIGKYNGHFLYLAYKKLQINILIIRRNVNIKIWIFPAYQSSPSN